MSQSTKDVLINKALSLFNKGELKKCLKETHKARKAYPDEPFIYNLLGVLYAYAESYDESLKNYSKAIKLNPKYAEAHNNMGVAYTHWKKFRKALEAFERAIEINPNYADAHNNKGNTFKEKGNTI